MKRITSTFLLPIALLMAANAFGIGPITADRPLMVVLIQMPGPTAAPALQWNSRSVSPNQIVPSNSAVGVSSSMTTGDIAGGSCKPLLGLSLNFDISTVNAAGIMVTINRMSSDGTAVVSSKVLFNGPGLAAQGQKDIKFPGGDLDVTADLLAGAADCSHWRMDVSDTSMDPPGTFNSWTLKRRIAWFPFEHDLTFYQNRVFGSGVVTPNLVDYFQAVSRVKFTFTQAGPIAGPFTDADWTLSDSSDVYTAQIVHILEAHGFNFAAFDKNHDGVITNDELTILAIDNTHDTSGAARNVDATLNNLPLRVHGSMALVSQQVDFHTMAHEVAHTIGAIDVYGIWSQECLSNGLTLMSCEPFKVDDTTVMFPDAWHRLKFGWTTAFPPGFSTGGLSYELGDETYIDDWGNRAQPAILRANPKNPNEYYLFEYRSGRGYDSGVASAGILAWHVIEDANGHPACGAGAPHCVYNAGPDNPVGGSAAWTTAAGRFRLLWSDGTPIPLSFWVTQPAFSSNSQVLHWDTVPQGVAAPTIRIVQPAASSGPVGSTVLQANVTVDPLCDKTKTTVVWSNDVDSTMGYGAYLGYTFFTPGKRTITATVHDSFGDVASATIVYTVNSVGPTATIYKPTANQTFYANQPVSLFGKGSSPVVLAYPCEQLTWTLDRQPAWSRSGCLIAPQFNILGKAVFTLTVVDAATSLTGEARVTVNFVSAPAGSPPIVTITSPLPGYLLPAANPATLSGVVLDPAGGPVGYYWTVFDPATKKETFLSTSPSFTWTPGTLITTSENIEIRLYGMNDRFQEALVEQINPVQQPPK